MDRIKAYYVSFGSNNVLCTVPTPDYIGPHFVLSKSIYDFIKLQKKYTKHKSYAKTKFKYK